MRVDGCAVIAGAAMDAEVVRRPVASGRRPWCGCRPVRTRAGPATGERVPSQRARPSTGPGSQAKGTPLNGLTKAVAVLAAAVAVVAAGCEAGPSTGPVGGETIIIGVDLPFQGVSKDASDDTWNALRLYLEQVGGKAGDHPVQLRKQDNSTAAKGAWDDATCTRNATQAAATENQVAVIGTYNSGCAKLEAPILNQAPGGPMLMVSHANTSSGLTRAGEVGEPEKYFPSGKRSYARVITTDDVQGSAAAQFAAQDLKVSRCFVLWNWNWNASIASPRCTLMVIYSAVVAINLFLIVSRSRNLF
jgi:ABC-type branched-subunit amino acid transport system substrate-binding protein